MDTRQRTKINYRKFVEPDSDDDFEESTPPAKKVKKESKKQPNLASDKQHTNTSSKRLSRDEKTFDREMQQALTVSVDLHTDRNVNVETATDRNTKTETGRNKVEECSDYSASEESRESSDSDFNGSTLATAATKKQTKKSKALKSKATPAVADDMKDVTAKNTRRLVATQPKATTPITPALGVKRMMPKWTPPAPAGSKAASPQVVSGGTPVIRLGLSRNARLKPLHCRTRPSS